LDGEGTTEVDCIAEDDSKVEVEVIIVPTEVWVGVIAFIVGVREDVPAIGVRDAVPDIAVRVGKVVSSVGVRETAGFVRVVDGRMGVLVGGLTAGVLLLSTGPAVGVTGFGVAVFGRRVGMV
jgi:hypothetical protein